MPWMGPFLSKCPKTEFGGITLVSKREVGGIFKISLTCWKWGELIKQTFLQFIVSLRQVLIGFTAKEKVFAKLTQTTRKTDI